MIWSSFIFAILLQVNAFKLKNVADTLKAKVKDVVVPLLDANNSFKSGTDPIRIQPRPLAGEAVEMKSNGKELWVMNSKGFLKRCMISNEHICAGHWKDLPKKILIHQKFI